MKYYYLNIPEGAFKYALYAITKNLQNFKDLVRYSVSFVNSVSRNFGDFGQFLKIFSKFWKQRFANFRSISKCCGIP